MTIPESVRIGGIDYTIEDAPFLGDIDRAGQIDYMGAKIQLNPACAEQCQCATLWHEILHGIAEQYDVKFPDGEGEHIIEALSRGVYQVLQDNADGLFGAANADMRGNEK